MLNITISKRSAFIIVLAMLLVFPAVAFASDVFDDVGDTGAHTDGITFMKDSGVSVGCDATNYCPSDNVTRAQMATFMYRLSGTDPATPPSVDADKLDGRDYTYFAPSLTTETLTLPADALSISTSGTILTRDNRGILWERSFVGSAYVIVQKPENWDGGDVVMDLWFVPTTAAVGVVNFFIRPRSFDVGSLVLDVIDLSSGASTAGNNVVAKQTITIPSDRLDDGDLWYITIQREGSGSTYTDDVILMNVTLTYGADR